MQQQFVYLASQSPRRRELLTQIGVAFETLDVEVDETRLEAEQPQQYVERVALLKAKAGYEKLSGRTDRPVLGADTTVVLDEQCLGKPENTASAMHMLHSLSGRQHEVLSAVALITTDNTYTALSRSQVTFDDVSDAQIQAYCESGEPLGKAGAYAIQGRGAVFVRQLQGSYSGVMGLPVYETAQLLRQASEALT